ncbi:hypothetical protein J2X90_002022 [Variovorax paradoxus]|uniref:hypothetical protein n=1 Tax=Variovorax paradoxus TaxID=34073 RepID=UPI0027893342|nr:hypothetical protein [Variovorax paradoxus]MDP9929170.1 hypothetical protein [Variovorax paradoxus]MDQ0024227.1 hypothetical protein [Variovorax paradoxus]
MTAQDPPEMAPGSPSAAGDQQQRHIFVYRGWRFAYSAPRMRTGVYRPVVVCLGQGTDDQETMLPDDTDEIAYATEAEALRHAQQQAMRWVHDRTGDGQGQF